MIPVRTCRRQLCLFALLVLTCDACATAMTWREEKHLGTVAAQPKSRLQ